ITCRTAAAVGAERCAIFLWRGGHLVPVMAQFADGHAEPGVWARFKALGDQPMEEVPAHAEAIRLRRPVPVTRESRLLPPDWFDSLGVGSALIVPLVSNDRVVGTMGLDASSSRTWPQSRLDLAMTIAAQVALAIDNAGHYQDARQRATEVETLAAIGETLTSTLDAQKVLEGIADSAATLIGAQRAVVFELDQGAGCLRARAVRGVGVEPGFTVRLGQGAAGHAALRLQPVWSDDVLERPLPGYDEPYQQSDVALGALALKYGGRAILAVPVISRDAALGAVCVCWDAVHRPDEREVRMLSALGRQAAIAMENARLVGDLRRTLEELRAAQETLVRGATLRAVGELAAGAAHHLNNLMAVVLGRTQLLLMKKPDPAVAASLRSIERAAVDAADTVRQIQGFAGTAKAGGATRFDLNTVIHEAIGFTRSRWQNEAKVRGASIEVQAQPGPIPEVSGRHVEIREVITNLILNAVDALPEGGRIVIATRAEPGRVIVSVSDSGVGMPAEVKRRAFEPFRQPKGPGAAGRLGPRDRRRGRCPGPGGRRADVPRPPHHRGRRRARGTRALRGGALRRRPHRPRDARRRRLGGGARHQVLPRRRPGAAADRMGRCHGSLGRHAGGRDPQEAVRCRRAGGRGGGGPRGPLRHSEGGFALLPNLPQEQVAPARPALESVDALANSPG
ncbi:MAG: hypothetical protein DMD86_18755, partial [Candidatus Rokuibacteriota bacterium]